MATLNELGRNSASITYGPSATGADQWPVLQLFDQWIRNDTLQGFATASSSTVTGVGTIFSTQVRAGDVIMMAGQMFTVASVTSDTVFVITGTFSPAITVATAIKVINTTLTGTVTTSVRGSTNGTVYVSNGSATITGVGTYFLSDMTNSVTTATVTGTVALDTAGNITGVSTTFNTGSDGAANRLQPGDWIQIGTAYFQVATVGGDTAATVTVPPAVAINSGTAIYKAANGVSGRTIVINGKVRQITSIASNTSMTVNLAMDFTDSNLKVKVYPRGTVVVTAGASSVAGTNTNFSWDFITGDQVWFGDELRTFTFSANATTVAAITDYTGYSGTAIGVLRQPVTGLTLHRDDTYITGSSSPAYTTELRVGDELIIGGTEVTVTQIVSASQFRVNFDFTHNVTAATVYKKKKIHGYVFEGTREGAGAGGKLTTPTTSALAAGQTFLAGATLIGVASTTSMTALSVIKIQAAGGPAKAITGVANTVATSTTVTGSNTLFTTELHVGAEIAIAGQYVTVTAIASDTSMTVSASMITTGISPIYRTVPLFTYIVAVGAGTVTLGHALKATLYSVGANPPSIYVPSVAGDFVEYVYSAPNKSCEATVTLFNTSNDRKYLGFRYYPLAIGSGTAAAIATAGSAYNLTVYERWAASHAQTNGVGVNKADQSDGTALLSGVLDQTYMSQTTGGFIYLFAKPRYFIMQGKTFGGVQQQWLGCVEFERAQPEDTGTGLGTTTGITYSTGSPPVSFTPGIAPWPCFAYFNGNRFPVGSTQTPTAPVTGFSHGVHGGIFAVPRIRLSTGDLVGANSHIYTAATITTGRWGHLLELGAGGSYNAITSGAITAGVYSNTLNTVWQPHMGQLVPVYTNVYNAKRFMFSPVVVLGPTYDPDIRGRIYGLKVIPSALGTLMDTVSVTIDSNDFYDSTQTAADHWVLTAFTTTYRLSMQGTNFQSTRSLEDGAALAINTQVSFPNNFRWAIPA